MPAKKLAAKTPAAKAPAAKTPAAKKRKSTARWSSRKLATCIARLADEKQAEKVVILDVAQAIQVSDYFVICEGQNRRHIGMIAEWVARELKHDGIHRISGTPLEDESWVLVDFGPVVLHVFSPKGRGYYDLENLWGDCPRVKWRRAVKKVAPATAIQIPTDAGFAPPVD